MKRYGKFITGLLAVLLLFAVSGTALAETEHEKHIRMAAALLDTMAKEKDASAIGTMLQNSKGVAIFPNVLRTGFITGSEHGEGIVLLKTKDGWTGPAFFSLLEGSVGLQAGIQEVGLLMIINNDEGIRAFTGGKSLKLGMDLGVVAGPVGDEVAIATDGRVKASIYTYSIAKGLFAGLALDGAILNQNRDAALAYWGTKTDAQQALSRAATGPKISQLVNALNLLAEKAQLPAGQSQPEQNKGAASAAVE